MGGSCGTDTSDITVVIPEKDSPEGTLRNVRLSWVHDPLIFKLVGLVFLAFFMWKDGALYFLIHNLHIPSSASVPNVKSVLFSVKFLFEDQQALYITTPLCDIFERITHLLEYASWITPNVVTTMHFCLGIFAAYLVNSDRLGLRQLSAVAYFLRTFLDTFDGYVYRFRAKLAPTPVGKEEFFTFGYYYDGMADGLATFLYFIGIIIYIRRAYVKSETLCPLRQCDVGCRLQRFWRASAKSQNTLIMLNFGFQCVLVSVLWNILVVCYADILNEASTHEQFTAQLEVLMWKSTFLILWVWRVIFLLTAGMGAITFFIFFDRIWDYVLVMRCVMWITVAIVYPLTIIHLDYAGDHVQFAT